MPVLLLVLLALLGVVAGLAFGTFVGDKSVAPKRAAADSRGQKGKPGIGTHVRSAVTDGAVRLWKWNRDRKRKADADDK
jgi:hypothetical protein